MDFNMPSIPPEYAPTGEDRRLPPRGSAKAGAATAPARFAIISPGTCEGAHRYVQDELAAFCDPRRVAIVAVARAPEQPGGHHLSRSGAQRQEQTSACA